jgi:hypothetical protein
VAWGHPIEQKVLLRLPFGALLQLLGDECMQVAAGREDTAVFTAAAWLEAHPEAASKAPQLLEVLRLPHCTPTFLSDRRMRQHLEGMGVTADEAYELCALSSLREPMRAEWLRKGCKHRAAWRLPRRPASSVTQLHMETQVPLADLRAVFEGSRHPRDTTPLTGPQVFWNGRIWSCGLVMIPHGRLCTLLHCVGGTAAALVALCLEATEGPGHAWSKQVYINDMTAGAYMYRGRGCSTWEQLQQWLEARHLIHPGDMLHISCTGSQVE